MYYDLNAKSTGFEGIPTTYGLSVTGVLSEPFNAKGARDMANVVIDDLPEMRELIEKIRAAANRGEYHLALQMRLDNPNLSSIISRLRELGFWVAGLDDRDFLGVEVDVDIRWTKWNE